MSDIGQGYLGWHAYNCMKSAKAGQLISIVEKFVSDFDNTGTVQFRMRGRNDNDETFEVRRQNLLDKLSIYSVPPQEDDAARNNLNFAAEEFSLDAIEVEILELVLRANLVHELDSFTDSVMRKLGSVSRAAAALIGHDAREVHARLLPSSRLAMSGILAMNLSTNCFTGHGGALDMPRNLRRVMGRPYESRQEWAEAILGPVCSTELTADDYPHVGDNVELASKLLRGVRESGAAGVNLLLHGPVGTGKTELAKLLAREAGCLVWSVGEADEEGGEPSRGERLAAVRLAQRLLHKRKDAILLVDEAEDILKSSQSFSSLSSGGGSKVFINRMLEEKGPSVIWTANGLGEFDDAYVRRMAMAIRVAEPPVAVRRKMRAKSADKMSLSLDNDAIDRLAGEWEAPPAVIVSALKTASLSGGGEADCALAMRGVMQALGRTPNVSGSVSSKFDAGIIGSTEDLGAFAGRVCRTDAPRNWSLLISGPSGTGKSQYARYLAERMNMQLEQVRASDLLSKWVGESEARIAAAFQRARSEQLMLVFDEADSLLASRETARQRWEVGQVNEMLTWMENHSLPFVCTTNFISHLDAAAMRRFTFKLKFSGMTSDQAVKHFFDLFGREVSTLPDGLTPGDFAIARRRHQFEPDADAAKICQWLEDELSTRAPVATIGFGVPHKKLATV